MTLRSCGAIISWPPGLEASSRPKTDAERHMEYLEFEVVAAVEALGVPLHKNFAMPNGLIGFRDEHGRLFFNEIEEDSLAAAAHAYLIRLGKS